MADFLGAYKKRNAKQKGKSDPALYVAPTSDRTRVIESQKTYDESGSFGKAVFKKLGYIPPKPVTKAPIQPVQYKKTNTFLETMKAFPGELVKTVKSKRAWEQAVTEGTGLGIVKSLVDLTQVGRGIKQVDAANAAIEEQKLQLTRALKTQKDPAKALKLADTLVQLETERFDIGDINDSVYKSGLQIVSESVIAGLNAAGLGTTSRSLALAKILGGQTVSKMATKGATKLFIEKAVAKKVERTAVIALSKKLVAKGVAKEAATKQAAKTVGRIAAGKALAKNILGEAAPLGGLYGGAGILASGSTDPKEVTKGAGIGATAAVGLSLATMGLVAAGGKLLRNVQNFNAFRKEKLSIKPGSIPANVRSGEELLSALKGETPAKTKVEMVDVPTTNLSGSPDVLPETPVVKKSTTTVYTGRRVANVPTVTKVEHDLGRVLTVEGDQHSLIKSLAAKGDAEAQKIAEKFSYVEADAFLQKRFSDQYDTIQYKNTHLPKKGVEYRDLKTGTSYAEDRVVAENYALQTRKAKYEKPLTKQQQVKANIEQKKAEVATKIVAVENKGILKRTWERITKPIVNKFKPITRLKDNPVLRANAEEFLTNAPYAEELGNNAANILADVSTKKRGVIDMDAYEAGTLPPEQSKRIRDFFDTAFKAAQELDPDIRHVENYLPHIWNNTPKEFDEAVLKKLKAHGATQAEIEKYLVQHQTLDDATAKRLGVAPFFTKERFFTSYKEGESYGLLRQYGHVAGTAGAYIRDLQIKKGARKFIDGLKEQGAIVQAGNQKNDWIRLHEGIVPGKQAWYAEPKLGKFLNDAFDPINGIVDSTLQKTGTIAKNVQEFPLSAGIPRTPTNFFTWAQAYLALAKGLGGSPSSTTSFMKAYVRAHFTQKTINWFKGPEQRAALLKLARFGMETGHRIGNFDDLYTPFTKLNWGDDLGLRKRFAPTQKASVTGGRVWQKVWSEKTFGGLMTMWQTDSFIHAQKQLVKRGMSPAAADRLAFEQIKNGFGLITQSGRSQNVENAMRTLFLAPKYREGILNVLVNVAKSYTTEIRNPAFKPNRQLLRGAVVIFTLANVVNYLKNGHFMHDNPPDKKFSIKIPIPGEQSMYIPIFPGVVSMPKNFIMGANFIRQGKWQEAERAYMSFASIALNAGLQVATNKDAFGRPIWKPTDTTSQRVGAILTHLREQANHPLLELLMKQAQDDNADLLSQTSKALELPITFRSKQKDEQQSMFASLDKLTSELAWTLPDHQPELIKAELIKFSPEVRAALLQGLNEANFGSATKGLDKLTDADLQRWLEGPHPEQILQGAEQNVDISEDNIFYQRDANGKLVLDKNNEPVKLPLEERLQIVWRLLRIDTSNTLKGLKSGIDIFGIGSTEVIRKTTGGDTVVFERKKGLSDFAPDKEKDVDHVVSLNLGGDNTGKPFILNLRSGNLMIMEKKQKAVKDAVESKLMYLHQLPEDDDRKISGGEARRRVKNWKEEWSAFTDDDYQKFYVRKGRGLVWAIPEE